MKPGGLEIECHRKGLLAFHDRRQRPNPAFDGKLVAVDRADPADEQRVAVPRVVDGKAPQMDLESAVCRRVDKVQPDILQPDALENGNADAPRGSPVSPATVIAFCFPSALDGQDDIFYLQLSEHQGAGY